MGQMVLDRNGLERVNNVGSHEPCYEMHARHVNGGGGINYYYICGFSGPSASIDMLYTVPANTFIAMPFLCPGNIQIDQMAVKLKTTSGTMLARIGLYTNLITHIDNPGRDRMQPNLALTRSAELSHSGSEAVYTHSVSPALCLDVGEIYWACTITDAGGTAARMSRLPSNRTVSAFGTTGLGAGDNICVKQTAAMTYGALPANAPVTTWGYTEGAAIGLRIIA